jgi:hypothetical protein
MFQALILAVQQGSKNLISRKDSKAARFNFGSTFSKQNVHNLIQSFFTIFGSLAIVFIIAMFFNPNLTKQFLHNSPNFIAPQSAAEVIEEVPPLAMLMATPQLISQANASEVEVTSATNKLLGTEKQQKLVTHWLAKRYRVAEDAIHMLVSASYLTAQETKLDPLLILSVMAIESRFNPFSQSPVGAQGLMQVMPKIHQDKFEDHGGIKAALNPVANIKVGALILKDYIQSSGSIESGLKRYVGAADMETDGGYGSLVIAEYQRLKAVAAGKTVSIFATTPKPAPSKPLETPANVNASEDLTSAKKGTLEQVAGL